MSEEIPTPRTDAEWHACPMSAVCDNTTHNVVRLSYARQLERELAEAREDAMDHKRMLQSLSKTQALDRAELDRSFQYIIKQRDTLAEAIEVALNNALASGESENALRSALVAVKGGKP